MSQDGKHHAQTDGEPSEMSRMTITLGVDHLLTGQERQAAARRCQSCGDPESCRVWLDITAIRGASQAPGYCRNGALFEDLANEAAAGGF